jgi:hypothetical protein
MPARCWTRRFPGRLDERVRDRIVAETRGNPLALLELPRGLTAEELAGGFGLPDARPLASRIEQSFLRRLQSLPVETQRLLTAATEPVGDVTLLWRAAERLGIGADAAAPAEGAGCSSSVPGCVSVIRWCARRPTGRRAHPTGRRYIARWPRRPIRTRIPITERGIAPKPRSGPMRRWPVSWIGRPTGHEAAAASRRRPRFSAELPS